MTERWYPYCPGLFLHHGAPDAPGSPGSAAGVLPRHGWQELVHPDGTLLLGFEVMERGGAAAAPAVPAAPLD